MNRTFKLYGIIFLVILVILGIFEVNKKEITDWRKNFDVTEKTPFGLYVFNEQINSLFSNNITKSTVSPYNFYKDEKPVPHNILIIQKYIDNTSINKILDQVKNGSDLMIIAEDVNYQLQETLNLENDYNVNNEQYTLKLTDKKFENTKLLIDKLSSDNGFEYINKDTEILGYKTDNAKNKMVVFIKVNYGKGHVYLHLEPLFLTNYYLLKPHSEQYTQDVLSYLPNRKTIWFVESNNIVSSSPMRFILSHPSLRYAWWIFLVGLLLFTIFNVKRRQRVVPVIEPLENKSVEFVKSIGNLYLQEGDFHDMMGKKAQYFLYKVRVDLLIDTKNLDEDFAKKLQLKTGKPMEKIKEAIILIKNGQDPYAFVTQEDLLKMNQLLDEILK